MAAAGDTVTLEGTFAATATITFPGGVSAPATILGTHRATVVVPIGASAGGLSVTTDGTTVGPLPFRRVSFALGLQNFRGVYEQAGTARQTPGFVTSRYGHTSVVVGNSLFIVGGTGGGGVQASIERATINADGSLGAFATLPDISLVTARSGHTSAVIGNSLYVIGGIGTNGILNSVERAAISVDGSLGPFATVADVTLTVGRNGHTSTIVGNSLYVFGGAANATKNLDSVERSTINADGSPSPFAIVTGVTLTTARNSHSCEIIGNSVFIIGGYAGSNGRLKSVERANINADGSLDMFVTIPGITLASARNGHASAVLGGSLYVIGGSGDNGLLNSIERAPIKSDGSLGAFATILGVTLASARNGHTATVIGDYLYILGGSGNSSLIINNLQWASINANGALGSFTTVSGVTLPDGRNSRTSVVAGNFLYVLGGTDSSNNYLSSIARAAINADGSLDPFTILSNITLTTARSIHACAIIGNWLYVLGGSNGSYLSSIERASISSDGSLGPFSLVPGRALVTPRIGHTIAVLGNNLYVVGGTTNGSGDLLSIEHAAINADGSLGPFAIEPAGTNTGHYGLTSIVTENYLYLVAGYSGANGILATVERSAINFNDGTLGIFATASSALSTKRFFHSSAVIGSYLYVLGGATMLAPASSVERAPMNADGSLGSFAALPTVTLAVGRSGHADVLIGNFLYTISGSADALHSVEQTTLP